MTRLFGVRVFTRIYSLDREYCYLSPENRELFIGDLVFVPFGNGDTRQLGAIVSVKEFESVEAAAKYSALSDISKLKFVFEKVDGFSFSRERLALCDYMRTRFFASFYECARVLLPPGFDTEAGRFALTHTEKRVKYIKIQDETHIDAYLASKKRGAEKLSKAIALLCEAEKKAMPLSDFVKQTALTYAVTSALCEAGICSAYFEREYRSPYSYLMDENLCLNTDSPLTDEQNAAFSQLSDMADSGEPACALLYGVTGSGKTRVMLRLIDKMIADGKSVIMLVPEIALTGQAMRLLISRYRDGVAVLHSALSEGERYDEWCKIETGEKKIVLGTRSAIFAPCKNLGLIIIDEEQDQSYKSDTHMRYHARDVARYLCAGGALLLLASATPDIESFYRAKTGRYKLLSLTKRYAGATLPEVETVDVRGDFRDAPGKLIGKRLREELTAVLSRNEQAILFINRRGFKQFMMCRLCGEVIMCPNCSVSLTLHVDGGQHFLYCHYCGYKTSVPTHCEKCGSRALLTMGYGTQQLEKQLTEMFPKARVLRLDADTITQKRSHDRIINSFKNREADILIGTQMVAKGHDFPCVTLVGVIMADSSLYSSDFRAKEQSFSLFTQVVGRAGRAVLAGKALIQTFSPYNETLLYVPTQDYDKFYDSEIALRRALVFPPFCDICVLEQKNTDEQVLKDDGVLLYDMLSEKLKNEFSDVKAIVYGPFEDAPYKVNNVFRKKTVLKFKLSRRSSAFIDSVLRQFPTVSGGHFVSADINPTNI